MSKDSTSPSFFRFADFASSFHFPFYFYAFYGLFRFSFALDLYDSLRCEIHEKNYFFRFEAKKISLHFASVRLKRKRTAHHKNYALYI
jgi:hypothetical protein